MDIGNFFSSSKKHDLSDNSREDTDPKKKPRKQHQTAVTVTTIFFEKGLFRLFKLWKHSF